ncbi:hypothetical protein Q3A66_03610 [Hymenobacter sp. BT770]|uniref:hypothetical protein n=1 Tax=Hymenobacter sp. BT770 TaxID=2886942 RepID=UPI001D119F97|nr:hypothetical protein [Hymenobacter sp. BT770]MCC3152329.1 hypothetical protein [Hymenobacter sp. BT770]MDO3414142.1 hypothetical protein [Hymenobacter sp. BT770]
MKRIACLLAIVMAWQLGWGTTAFAQKGFDVQHLGLLNAKTGSKTKLGLGQGTKAAVKALGRPTRKGSMYFEMEADTAVVYYYNANKLYFLKDGLVGFELNDNTLAFGKSPEQAFRVGGVLTSEIKPFTETKSLKSGAPTTYTRYLIDNNVLRDLKPIAKPGRSRNINYKAIAANHTRYGDEKYDGWFEILFDGDNRVINIATGE